MQISKVERFATIVNGYQPLTIIAKLYILDICKGSFYYIYLTIIKNLVPAKIVYHSEIIIYNTASSQFYIFLIMFSSPLDI